MYLMHKFYSQRCLCSAALWVMLCGHARAASNHRSPKRQPAHACALRDLYYGVQRPLTQAKFTFRVARLRYYTNKRWFEMCPSDGSSPKDVGAGGRAPAGSASFVHRLPAQLPS